MLIDFSALEEVRIPRFMGGEKETVARMYLDGNGKIMTGSLEPGASIGMHTHETSSEIVYILSGRGRAVYDGAEEALRPGVCHYCPKWHRHSLISDGPEPLNFLAIVPEQ